MTCIINFIELCIADNQTSLHCFRNALYRDNKQIISLFCHLQLITSCNHLLCVTVLWSPFWIGFGSAASYNKQACYDELVNGDKLVLSCTQMKSLHVMQKTLRCEWCKEPHNTVWFMFLHYYCSSNQSHIEDAHPSVTNE